MSSVALGFLDFRSPAKLLSMFVFKDMIDCRFFFVCVCVEGLEKVGVRMGIEGRCGSPEMGCV